MLLSLAYLLWQAGAVAALGAGLFLLRAGPVPVELLAWSRRVFAALAWAGLLAFCAGLGVLACEATRILGHPLHAEARVWWTLLTHTRLGQVWLAKQALLLSLSIMLVMGRHRHTRACWISIGHGATFLALGTWAGHGGAGTPILLHLPPYALHALASGAWLGALPVWAGLLQVAGLNHHQSHAVRAYVLGALRRFSACAALMMGVLVMSGGCLAWWQFARWPALFATPAAAWLWLKLTLLAVVLLAAWRLRSDHLARLAADFSPRTWRAARRVFMVEAAAALALFVVALELAHGVPGAHQELSWWLPFRFSPAAAWSTASTRWQVLVGVGVAACALPAWYWRYRSVMLAAPCVAVLICAQALTVRAYATTYLAPAVPYEAASIARGAAFFGEHCAACHGGGARGDGDATNDDAIAPADLSRHTALHTAGDMFAWLSDGTASGAMPGFRAVLSDAQRWDLINLLRAFADGQRARILRPAVEARRPWLGAPNFHYRKPDGSSGELKDWRSRAAVLLLVASGTRATTRIEQLHGELAALNAKGLHILLLPVGQPCAAFAFVSAEVTCIAAGGEAVLAAYPLLMRTLQQPGPRDALAPAAGDAEFLIDRFGYLRARWLPGDGVPAWSPQRLREMQRALASEPRIRDEPEAHVH